MANKRLDPAVAFSEGTPHTTTCIIMIQWVNGARRPLILLGTSRRALRAFPDLPRRLAGFQLRRVQQGVDPADWKPMPSVGPGVREIRIHVDGAHRVFYVATRGEAIYVLHAFEKKTRKTAARICRLVAIVCENWRR